LKSILVIIILCICSGVTIAQNGAHYLNINSRPMHQTDISVRDIRPDNTSALPWKQEFKLADSWQILPLADLENGLDPSNENIGVLNNSIGAGIVFKHSKLYAQANYLFGYNTGPDYIRTVADNSEIIPGIGYANPLGNNFAAHMIFGKVRYNPNHFFTFELGRDKHFLGYGYRSLMLSDNASPYPYFKIDTKVWKIRYSNIFSWLQDISDANGDPSKYKNKFTTSHYLDWNVTKSWSIGIFESIIWQGKDTLLNRGFDINYLNPVIFYRPVEFSQGSADNAILGLNTRIKITDNHHIYSQIVIDEFLLSEIRADIRNFIAPSDTAQFGWWANKYAFQLGYKYFNAFNVDGLDLQSELNLVRPFTYSHGSSIQNYAHFNQALAHPRGANFYEWILFVRYQKDNWRLSNQFIWSNYGTDSDSISYGGNLYERYQNRVGTYFHSIGQGLHNVLLYNDIKLSYLINKATNLEASIGYRIRYNSNKQTTEQSNLLYIGLKTQLWNRYTDY